MVKKTSQTSPARVTSAVKKPARQAKEINDIVDRYRTHDKDTGSPEVQVALITKRINTLADHLRTHQKDFDSKRGLLMLVGKRRRLLNYVGRHHQEKYQTLIAELGLRK